MQVIFNFHNPFNSKFVAEVLVENLLTTMQAVLIPKAIK